MTKPKIIVVEPIHEEVISKDVKNRDKHMQFEFAFFRVHSMDRKFLNFKVESYAKKSGMMREEWSEVESYPWMIYDLHDGQILKYDNWDKKDAFKPYHMLSNPPRGWDWESLFPKNSFCFQLNNTIENVESVRKYRITVSWGKILKKKYQYEFVIDTKTQKRELKVWKSKVEGL